MGAKFSGTDFAPDEFVQPKVDLDSEGKRDRWNGYNLDDHEKVNEIFKLMEEVTYKLEKKL